MKGSTPVDIEEKHSAAFRGCEATGFNPEGMERYREFFDQSTIPIRRQGESMMRLDVFWEYVCLITLNSNKHFNCLGVKGWVW